MGRNMRPSFKSPGLWVQHAGLVEPVRREDGSLFPRASQAPAGSILTAFLLALVPGCWCAVCRVTQLVGTLWHMPAPWMVDTH